MLKIKEGHLFSLYNLVFLIACVSQPLVKMNGRNGGTNRVINMPFRPQSYHQMRSKVLKRETRIALGIGSLIWRHATTTVHFEKCTRLFVGRDVFTIFFCFNLSIPYNSIKNQTFLNPFSQTISRFFNQEHVLQ